MCEWGSLIKFRRSITSLLFTCTLYIVHISCIYYVYYLCNSKPFSTFRSQMYVKFSSSCFLKLKEIWRIQMSRPTFLCVIGGILVVLEVGLYRSWFWNVALMWICTVSLKTHCVYNKHSVCPGPQKFIRRHYKPIYKQFCR